MTDRRLDAQPDTVKNNHSRHLTSAQGTSDSPADTDFRSPELESKLYESCESAGFGEAGGANSVVSPIRPESATVDKNSQPLSRALSLILCTYNRSELLNRLLKSLFEQIDRLERHDIEVIAVDNNSADETAQTCCAFSERYATFRYIHEQQQGLSFARNRGAAVAQGAYLCFIDDDCELTSDYLRNVLEVISTMKPDIFGGPVLPFFNTKKPSWFTDTLEARWHADSTGFHDCLVSGGNFAIRRALLFHLGGFDPGFGMRGEELILGDERLLLERYRQLRPPEARKIFYSLDCVVRHLVPPHKMRLCYVLRRAAASGRMQVRLARLGLDSTARRPGKVPGSVDHPLKPRKKAPLWLRFLHRATMLGGVAAERLRPTSS